MILKKANKRDVSVYHIDLCARTCKQRSLQKSALVLSVAVFFRREKLSIFLGDFLLCLRHTNSHTKLIEIREKQARLRIVSKLLRKKKQTRSKKESKKTIKNTKKRFNLTWFAPPLH